MAKKYNKRFFRIFKKTNKGARNNFASDPLEQIKETGIFGKIIGKGCDKLIEAPIRQTSYNLTGLTYDKKHDNPCKGAVTYTAWYMTLNQIGKIVVGFLLSLPICSTFVSFLNKDLVTQMRMSLGFIPLFLLGYGIYRMVKWLKKNLK